MLERRSLDVARQYYVDELHGTGYREVGKPYDIEVDVAGVVRRCEVKGSSLEIDTVELTINEVDHSSGYTPTDLIVVDGITPLRDRATGEATDATGGRRRIWPDWTPDESDLKPTKYAYKLPPRCLSLELKAAEALADSPNFATSLSGPVIWRSGRMTVTRGSFSPATW